MKEKLFRTFSETARSSSSFREQLQTERFEKKQILGTSLSEYYSNPGNNNLYKPQVNTPRELSGSRSNIKREWGDRRYKPAATIMFFFSVFGAETDIKTRCEPLQSDSKLKKTGFRSNVSYKRWAWQLPDLPPPLSHHCQHHSQLHQLQVIVSLGLCLYYFKKSEGFLR